jgi:AraC-like DNA-binding protein
MTRILYYANLLTPFIFYMSFAILFFCKRKKGDRSRAYLGIMCLTMLSGVIIRIGVIHLGINIRPLTVTTPSMLIWSVFLATVHQFYTIEVVKPKWLNLKRIILLLCPAVVLFLFDRVIYKPTLYYSLLETLNGPFTADAALRWVYSLLKYAPLAVVWTVVSKEKSWNENRKWVLNYLIALLFLYAGSSMVVVFDTVIAYYISNNMGIAVILFITYNEMFVRRYPGGESVKKKENMPEVQAVEWTPEVETVASVEEKMPEKEEPLHTVSLKDELARYMDREEPWKKPDITIVEVAKTLHTNRTTLARIIKEQHFDSFSAYINKYRIDEYIKIIEKGEEGNLLEPFKRVGYRSKATALRNFRLYKGTTPTEYFKKR